MRVPSNCPPNGKRYCTCSKSNSSRTLQSCFASFRHLRLPAIAIRATITTLPLYCVPFMKIETKAVHIGRKAEAGSRDVTPAIHLSTTFQKAEDGSLPGGYLYSRPNNPNRAALEEVLASLEEGAAALAFSSGNAATASFFQAP